LCDRQQRPQRRQYLCNPLTALFCVDPNPQLNAPLTAFQRRYVAPIKRCDELERKIRYFSEQLVRFKIDTVPARQQHENPMTPRSNTYYIEQLEETTDSQEKELQSLILTENALQHDYNEYLEFTEVLDKFSGYVAGVAMGDRQQQADLLVRFTTLSGVLLQSERARFERMVFRSSRGNCFVEFFDVAWQLADPATGTLESKVVFVMFFQSMELETRLRKICDAFRAHMYSVPSSDLAAVEELRQRVTDDMRENRVVYQRNHGAVIEVLQGLSGVVRQWEESALKEKAIYHAMNTMRSEVGGMMRAEGWVVQEQLERVRSTVSQLHAVYADGDGDTGFAMPSVVSLLPAPWPEPPTYFDTNKFTACFQALVDTYGVPRYREINPAVFTACTFPFLFGVMYGDVGHGFCLFLGGLLLVLTEESREGKQLNELMAGLHLGRYMILMMGVFAVYCGLVYNDYLSLGLDFFGTKWEYACCCDPSLRWNTTTAVPDPAGGELYTCGGGDFIKGCDWKNPVSGQPNAGAFPAQCPDPVPAGATARPIGAPPEGCVHDPTHPACPSGGNVYAFGLDPRWKGTTNELLFFNSLKMKLSVILGIIQMTFGVVLKGLNGYHSGDYAEILLDTVPQLAFATSLFVYMIFLIVKKW
jgi:V-type H+-transporting ATPase subunit a